MYIFQFDHWHYNLTNILCHYHLKISPKFGLYTKVFFVAYDFRRFQFLILTWQALSTNQILGSVLFFFFFKWEGISCDYSDMFMMQSNKFVKSVKSNHSGKMNVLLSHWKKFRQINYLVLYLLKKLPKMRESKFPLLLTHCANAGFFSWNRWLPTWRVLLRENDWVWDSYMKKNHEINIQDF